MTAIIIIILIVVLVIIAIVVNAYQQYKAKMDAERRAEIAKQRTIIDETENVLMATSQMPISQGLIRILLQRIQRALQVTLELNPGSPDLKQNIQDIDARLKSIDVDPDKQNQFTLPETDKMIIQYIQAVKKLRIMIRSERSKGKIDGNTFMEQDKQLERLQLKVNVETLIRRGRAAQQTNMLGSARQYFEKAVTALENQVQPDEFCQTRLDWLKQQLQEIQENLKNVNAQDRAKKKEQERDELDELFAPKKKW
ncbi:hypothetical protein SAMN05216361_1773 [Marisediminitalea aggregata]|uniref:DNA repair protein n=1 Tax=Marisediminitalea aggregata TaxID=634436 RepID=A0A1M5IQY6_9ALTE|nr:hypothetical protein [Marisediminitalea aggregata]MAP22494.1 hypothetical protein [Alteromonadaceae bacterium]MCP3864384.1 hypothetical protein [Aestuariibacter sp.]BBO27692.1 DNA repair ATPase [Alteromonas sp. I4]HBY39743.1 hypothetical protein [Alteromonas sp.]MAX44128.1 hypothetical protein [Alteromonadaceae bacterium]|tara:strand:- start:138 stop:899 length:762 start_codon:yes stop_codon:yes gene_type:complete